MIRPTQDSDSSEDEWEYDDEDGIADWNSDDSFSHLPPEVYENFEKGMSIQATLYRTPVIYRPRDIHWRGPGGFGEMYIVNLAHTYHANRTSEVPPQSQG